MKSPKAPQSALYTVRLSGGLGNQMFQYAAARALSLRHNALLSADTNWFNQPFDAQTTPREYSLRAFNIKLHETEERITTALCLKPTYLRITNFLRHRIHIPTRFLPRHITEPDFNYWDGFRDIPPPAYIDGYWQSDKYFADHANVIKTELSLRSPPNHSAPMSERIASAQSSVSLHVRRGDYVNSPAARKGHAIDTHQYYTNALNRISELIGAATIFAFSDDPEWVRTNFDFGKHRGVVVDGKWADHEDMRLMSQCSHHIIANSSFSWWGAWLGTSQGITIAPKQWFSNPQIRTPDLCPATWERLPC